MNKPTVLILSLLLLLGLVVPYYLWVGSVHPVSDSSTVWGTFGDYVGGIGGTVLSFVSVVLVVQTIRLQMQQDLKRDQLEHIAAADRGIEHWLHRRLAMYAKEGQEVEFGDVVWGLIKAEDINPRELNVACERLLSLTALYCQAISLYRDNVDTHFVYQYHRKRAESLLAFLKDRLKGLPSTAGTSIALCQGLIDGTLQA